MLIESEFVPGPSVKGGAAEVSGANGNARARCGRCEFRHPARHDERALNGGRVPSLQRVAGQTRSWSALVGVIACSSGYAADIATGMTCA